MDRRKGPYGHHVRRSFLKGDELLNASRPAEHEIPDTPTHARSQGRDPLHLVSAWASRQRLVLGQQACAAKSNEITAIPLLLERLALTGALVTIDAMGCQTKIAQAILDKGADYLLAVKDNWPTLCGEIEGYFADAGDEGVRFFV